MLGAFRTSSICIYRLLGLVFSSQKISFDISERQQLFGSISRVLHPFTSCCNQWTLMLKFFKSHLLVSSHPFSYAPWLLPCLSYLLCGLYDYEWVDSLCFLSLSTKGKKSWLGPLSCDFGCYFCDICLVRFVVYRIHTSHTFCHQVFVKISERDFAYLDPRNSTIGYLWVRDCNECLLVNMSCTKLITRSL